MHLVVSVFRELRIFGVFLLLLDVEKHLNDFYLWHILRACLSGGMVDTQA